MSEYFSLWQEQCLADVQAQEQTRETLHAFAKKEPFEAAIRDHILRALTFLFALQKPQQNLIFVEEWVSEKHVQGFFLRLQETFVREKKFLCAYILAHDIGKKDPVFREECLLFVGCAASEGKLLRELITIHMEITREITQKKETNILRFAQDIAHRQGINADRFLALLPAAFFLDAVVGSLNERLSSFERAALLTTYAEQEYRSFPQRKEEDVLKMHRQKKEEKRAQLAAYGLSPEEWFITLHTPYGKERGEVVKILEHFIKGIEDEEDVRYVGAEHTHELRMRSARLRVDS